MGWEALKNGELLDAAQEFGFEVFITVDQNIRYQQNLQNRSIGICVLISEGIAIEKLNLLVPKLDEILDKIEPGDLHEVKL